MTDTTWFWQIVDARGLADVSSDEVVALREIIAQGERAEAELDAVAAALPGVRFMDPPDGGSPTLAEQVARMRSALAAAEARVSALEAENAGLVAALEPFGEAGEKLPDDRVITEAHPEWNRCMRRFKSEVDVLTVRQFRHAFQALSRSTEKNDD